MIARNLILRIAVFSEFRKNFIDNTFVTFAGACQSRIMLLLRYFSPTTSLPASVPSLMLEALRDANKRVAGLATEAKEAGLAPKRPKTSHYNYSGEDRARIGKYAAEHSPTKAASHFWSLLKRPVPESTARFLKKQYLTELRN